MSEPLAYLITFRTYGTWLHGDERGSVDLEHNTFGTPLMPAQPKWAAHEAAALRNAAPVLDDLQRTVVDRAVRDRCAFRGWDLLELAVRTNHVHAVVMNPGLPPERVMEQLKQRATRCLRDAGLIGADARVWARHGSTRYLWKPEHVNAAAAYVREGQDVPR